MSKSNRLKTLYQHLWVLLFVAAFSVIMAGCASLQPGADPLVVRTEQSLTVGKSAFDTVLGIDHVNRPFWVTNAPVFHQFCEWLRQPQPVAALNTTLPRASALLYSLDMVKQDYKAARATSNTLYTALMTFESITGQAQAWLTIATNPPVANP